MDVAPLFVDLFNKKFVIDKGGAKFWFRDYVNELVEYGLAQKVLMEYRQCQIGWRELVKTWAEPQIRAQCLNMELTLTSRMDFFEIYLHRATFGSPITRTQARHYPHDLSKRMASQYGKGVPIYVVPSRLKLIIEDVIDNGYGDLNAVHIYTKIKKRYPVVTTDTTLWAHIWKKLLKTLKSGEPRELRYRSFTSGVQYGHSEEDQTNFHKLIWYCRKTLVCLLPPLEDPSFDAYVTFVVDYHCLNIDENVDEATIREMWSAAFYDKDRLTSVTEDEPEKVEEDLWNSRKMKKWWSAFRIRRSERRERESEFATQATLLISDFAITVDEDGYAIPLHRLYMNDIPVVDFMKQLVIMNVDLPIGSEIGLGKWQASIQRPETDQTWYKSQTDSDELKVFWEESSFFGGNRIILEESEFQRLSEWAGQLQLGLGAVGSRLRR